MSILKKNKRPGYPSGFFYRSKAFLCSQTIVTVDQCHFFVSPHTAAGRMMKKIILSFIAGVIVFQNCIADNKTDKVTSRIFEPVSDLSTDAFPAPLHEANEFPCLAIV